MRLSKDQIDSIKQSVKDIYGQSSKVLLFGSRVHDSKKGGDIDLLIELESKQQDQYERQFKLNGRLQRKLGQQKIDILTHVKGVDLNEIETVAYQEGQFL